jgi:hypothetical protein
MGSIKSNTNQERQIMKNIRFLTFVLTLATLVLSACGAATATPTAAPASTKGANVEAMPVSFIGIVDRIAGDQWVISGTTVTVDESIVRDGPFQVGDQVKVEGFVNPDGSFSIERVESPAPQETATQPPVVADNSNEALGNANTNDANVNDDNGNTNDDNSNDDDGNTNDDNSNDDDGNSNDDNSNDDDGNSNDDNSNDDDGNSNDDNGNDDDGNSNDDGDNGNDDNGGNSNDDDSNDDNGGNSNDDDDKDDNGNDD